jgi:hypothetical protein
MSDDAKRSGTSAKLGGTAPGLTVLASKAEVATRTVTPPHSPGRAGQITAFDVLDANGNPRSIAVDLGSAATVS